MKRLALGLSAVLLLAGCAGSGVRSTDDKQAARINTQLGSDYLRRGQADLAEEKLKRAIKQDPDYALAYVSLAYLYSQRGDLGDAERAYRRALRLDPGNAVVKNNFAVFLCRHNPTPQQVAEAERMLVEAAQDPSYSTPEAAWTNAGVCLRSTQPEKAERYFRAALEVQPEFPEALKHMAWLSYAKLDYLRTRAFLQRYQLKGPATPETLWLRARVEHVLGDAQASLQFLRRLKTEFPESEQAATPIQQ
jgi:type IV pilus assembly protein PilF